MDTNGITPVMPLGGDAFGGSNSFFWVFALLVLMGGGFGSWGGNGNTNALSADMQRGVDNQNSQAMARDILANSTANAASAIAAIKDGNASLIREFGNVETALTAIGGQMQSCCCNIRQDISASKYETAMQMAALEQRILSKLDANEIQSLRDQVSSLQLQAATSNVLRYPNSWTYNGGVFPPTTAAAAA